MSVADNVLAKVRDSVLPALPPGMTLTVASNDSTFVLEMVAALEDHLLEGTLLAALVVWLFLRNLRSTLIVSLAIPVSLLGAVALMYFLGYTFNTITLLAPLSGQLADRGQALANAAQLALAGPGSPPLACISV